MAEITLNGVFSASPAPARVLDYFGDSTIFGAKPNSDPVDFPPTYYVKLPGYTVNNRGLNGDSLDYLLAYHSTRKGWAGLMKDSSANVVVLNHAINDRNLGTPISTYKDYLRLVIHLALVNGKRVVLETPNPVNISGPTIPLADYAQAIRDVAAEFELGVIDQYAYITSIIDSFPISNYLADTAHPTQSMYMIKGQFANKELFKILCTGGVSL